MLQPSGTACSIVGAIAVHLGRQRRASESESYSRRESRSQQPGVAADDRRVVPGPACRPLGEAHLGFLTALTRAVSY